MTNALAQNIETRTWNIIRLEVYYHDPKEEGDTPTTEYYSNQIKMFITYLQKRYKHIPINTLVIDSEAAHFHNRLTVDGIRHELAKKGAGSVDRDNQYMQSMFYKDKLLIYEHNCIRYFYPDGTPVFSARDISLEELESYHYDEIKSEREGINCYVKEFDHSRDGLAYILAEFKDTGRAPVI